MTREPPASREIPADLLAAIRNAARQEQFLEVVSATQARERFERHLDLSPLSAEPVALARILGRVLAANIAAPIDVPPFDRSGVDGFAVRAADTAGASDRARGKLEAILHPAIRRAVDHALAAAAAPYSIVVVPLLFETGGYVDRVRRTLVVDCAEELQLERAVRRPGLDAAQVRSIMRSQWPRWRRLQMADDVVWNGGEPQALDPQCAALDARYRVASR